MRMNTHALGTLAAFRADEIARGQAAIQSIRRPCPEKASNVGGTIPPAMRKITTYTSEYRESPRRSRSDGRRTVQAYMMARLTKGDHPDTDANFWVDHHPAAPPEIVTPRASCRRRKMIVVENVVLLGLCVVVIVVSGLLDLSTMETAPLDNSTLPTSTAGGCCVEMYRQSGPQELGVSPHG